MLTFGKVQPGSTLSALDSALTEPSLLLRSLCRAGPVSLALDSLHPGFSPLLRSCGRSGSVVLLLGVVCSGSFLSASDFVCLDFAPPLRSSLQLEALTSALDHARSGLLLLLHSLGQLDALLPACGTA